MLFALGLFVFDSQTMLPDRIERTARSATHATIAFSRPPPASSWALAMTR
jgi:hypothetical protein